MSEMIESNWHKLQAKHQDQRIVLCPMVGAQLNKICVNANEARQKILNDAIWDINSTIYQLNRTYKTSTPWISRTVHKSHVRKGRQKSYLKMSDGLHPDTLCDGGKVYILM